MLKKIFSYFFRLSQNNKQKHTLEIKQLKTFFILNVLLLPALFIFFPRQAQAVIIPTILTPETNNITTNKPRIGGVSTNDTAVEIYIDQKLVGSTKTNNHSTGVGNFLWQTITPLSPGVHSLNVRAIDLNTREAGNFSEPVFVDLIPFGTPTLLLPDLVTSTKPLTEISGVVHNKSTIHVFVDGVLVDTFFTGESQTGAVGFKHKLKEPITSGRRTLYLQAKDETGKPSLPGPIKVISIVDFPAPTLISPSNNTISLENQIVLSGIAYNDSKIKVYVNGRLDGELPVINDPSRVGHFSYKLKKPLERGAIHNIYTKAVAPDGRISQASSPINVFVDNYFVTPTLLKVTKTTDQIQVSGVAHNDSTIHLFVDNELDSVIEPKNDPSGTLYFETKLATTLSSGSHRITAQAFDHDGKPSNVSSPYYYNTAPVVTTPKPVPSPRIQEEKTTEEGEVSTEGKETEDVEKEKATEETGTITTEDEEEGKAEEDAGKEDEAYTTSNWPLILGILILIGLGILFIIWYLGQKRRLLNEGIDKLFSEEGIDTIDTETLAQPQIKEEKQGDLFETKKESKMETIETKKDRADEKESKTTKKDSFEDIPPPPPAI